MKQPTFTFSELLAPSMTWRVRRLLLTTMKEACIKREDFPTAASLRDLETVARSKHPGAVVPNSVRLAPSAF